MNIKILTIIGLIFTSMTVYSQNPNFHIYLCFGQSNMEGSAEIEEQDQVVHQRFKMMQTIDDPENFKEQGKWYAAYPPLSMPIAGLSPADYFGRTMIENLPDSITIGVINVAIGGCDIRLFDRDQYKGYVATYPGDWFTGRVEKYSGNPYLHLMSLAKEAQKDGVIKGILLHQGETNTGNEEWPEYVKTIYNNMLSDLSLDAATTPLLAGEVVGKEQGGVCASMNTIIAKLPDVIPTAHVISSKGCMVRTDSLHFNSVGVRELGKRYAEKMLELKAMQD